MHTGLYISELLYTRDCVIIPGLGGFVANSKSAFLNPAQHTFSPPSRKIAFNAGLRTNDGLLAHYISGKRGISYGEALTEIKLYVEELFNRLSAGEQIWIEKIGSLTFDKENRIQFEPDTTENYLTDSFGLVTIHSPAIRREEKAKVIKPEFRKEKKSRQGWRLLELIPAAAILVLLFFNPKIVQTLNTGLANLIPLNELFREPKTVFEVANQTPGPATSTVITTPADTTTSLPQEVTTEEAPVTPVDSTKVETVVVEESAVIEKKTNETTNGTFYIIGGCFRIEENAKKLVEEANLLGFEASVIGTNEHGMHVVSLYSSRDMHEVQEVLTEIKTGFEKDAWVLVK